MSLNIKLILDTRRARKDGTYPLVMRIMYNRKSTNVPLGLLLQEKDWNASKEKVRSSAKLTENISRLNNQIEKKRVKAYDLINQLEEEGKLGKTGLTEIKNILLQKTDKSDDVFLFIKNEISSLEIANKHGNADVYRSTRNKLLSHRPNGRLKFSELDYRFLKSLEQSHYSKGYSVGGLSVYLRTIRAVYRKAIKLGNAQKEDDPFVDYKIKSGKPVRKALSQSDFTKLIEYEFEQGSVSDRTKKLFLASFYLRGANWVDMAYMKWENVEGDLERIGYVRLKTKEPFNIKVHPKLREIILSFTAEMPEKTDFLFPILVGKELKFEDRTVIRNSRKNLNRRLKTISKELGIQPFSIYAARHTYATTAKRKGVPIAVIQEGMGHSTEAITQNYLDSFENKTVDDYDNLIMS